LTDCWITDFFYSPLYAIEPAMPKRKKTSDIGAARPLLSQKAHQFTMSVIGILKPQMTL
jgi:hypothetical protein